MLITKLRRLIECREDILLAEIAAWLHDWKKCSDEHLKAVLWQNYNRCRNEFIRVCSSFTPQHAQGLPNSDFTGRFFPNVQSQIVNLCSSSLPIEEVVRKGRRGREDTSLPLVIWLLRKSHHTAHMEKELEDCELEGLQCTYTPRKGTVFGFELQDLRGLTSKLGQIGPAVRNRAQIFTLLRPLWLKALGDTRHPINEVTLWDWSSIVAALYKAEIARCVLDGPRKPDQVAWRLLSIRTDGLEYMLSAPSIPDLLARKELLTDAWNGVQKVLEEEYPLGLEIYRDENGPVFVVPDLENLLGLENSNDNYKSLREYILEAFRQGTVKEDLCLALDGEIIPVFKLDKKPWKGQPAPDELPPVGEHLEQLPPFQSDPVAIAQAWCNHTDEVCTVCGLRPQGRLQGPGRKAKSRKMCDICEQRRADRAKAWAEGIALSSEKRFLQGKPDTIWLDEVADANGRLALIVGQFDLEYWLDGTLVRSLAVCTPNDQNGHTDGKVAKNPSFARLRRIWETTRRFWQDVAPTGAPPKELVDFCQQNGLSLKDLWEGPLSLEKSVAGKTMDEKRPRIFLKAQNANELAQDLGPFHAYEMVVRGRKVAVLWVSPDATDDQSDPLPYRGGFWVIENLAYLDCMFNQKIRDLLQAGGTYEIYEPSEYGKPGEPIAQMTVESIQEVSENYVPLTPILSEPRTFMALVPADKALKVVKAIKAKYEREMGKVRNRLPLHLGIVFADAHQPLRTVLDAGRRMLAQKAKPLIWRVICPARKLIEKGNLLPSYFSNDQEGQFKEWLEVVLEDREEKLTRTITWYVPALMGDGRTEDHWYPYVFLAQEDEPTDRNRYFAAQNPWNKEHKWLVHAGELKEGDTIYLTPATFDFIWLDHAGTRFEIAYDEDGWRLGLPRRPYLLDDLGILEEIWETLKKSLANSQIHALRELIEVKREEWLGSEGIEDPVFRRFCRDALANAQWRRKPWGKDERHDHWLNMWTGHAVNGWITDAVEIFSGVMKQRSEVGE